MFRSPPAPEVPLLLAGIPALLEDWLRTAGVAVAEFRAGSGLDPQVRRRSGQIVLFDSRSAPSRCDARIARDLRLETVNVAPLLEGVPAADPSPLFSSPQSRRLGRGMFFDRLKEEIEALGGLWLRVSEYPFPYQSALIVSGDLADGPIASFAEAFVPIPDGHDDPAAWMLRRYRAGLPARIPAGENLEISLSPRDFPLLWRTTADEFARWWTQRSQITLRARHKATIYHIEADIPPSRHRPLVELWRTNHVAAIPLANRETAIPQDGLVFQQEHDRHPAGFAARWKDETAGEEPIHLCEQQAS